MFYTQIHTHIHTHTHTHTHTLTHTHTYTHTHSHTYTHIHTHRAERYHKLSVSVCIPSFYHGITMGMVALDNISILAVNININPKPTIQ